MKKQGFWNVKNKALASGIAYLSGYGYEVKRDDKGETYYEFPMTEEVMKCWDMMTKVHKKYHKNNR